MKDKINKGGFGLEDATPYDFPVTIHTVMKDRPKSQPQPRPFTVIIEHVDEHPDGDRTILAVVVRADDHKTASDEACLWCISDRGGTAAGCYVIAGSHTIHPCDGEFNAEDHYDETSTHAGYVSHKQVYPKS